MSDDRVSVGMYAFRTTDPQRLAAFWAALMDLPTADGADDDLVMLDLDHVVGSQTWMFERGDREGAGRLGLDLTAAGGDLDATSARAERLGATRVADREQDGIRWTELTDPDGNPFRVFGPRS